MSGSDLKPDRIRDILDFEVLPPPAYELSAISHSSSNIITARKPRVSGVHSIPIRSVLGCRRLHPTPGLHPGPRLRHRAMGSGCSSFGSKSRTEESITDKGNYLPPRPHNGARPNGDAFLDPEKPGNFSGRSATYPTSHVPDAASRRTDLDRYHSEKRRDEWAASPTATQASDLTMATTLNGTERDTKLKEEDVDDPEARGRARKAEEARIKAEKEEQERMDFLQWM